MELGYCLKDCMVALARCDAVQEAALWLTEKRETLAAGKSFSVVFSIFFIWSYNCYKSWIDKNVFTIEIIYPFIFSFSYFEISASSKRRDEEELRIFAAELEQIEIAKTLSLRQQHLSDSGETTTSATTSAESLDQTLMRGHDEATKTEPIQQVWPLNLFPPVSFLNDPPTSKKLLVPFAPFIQSWSTVPHPWRAFWADALKGTHTVS